MKIIRFLISSNSSTKRLDSILKGHELWKVVDECNEKAGERARRSPNPNVDSNQDEDSVFKGMVVGMKNQSDLFHGVTVDLKVTYFVVKANLNINYFLSYFTNLGEIPNALWHDCGCNKFFRASYLYE